jgi:hypothetical protein
MKQLLLTICTFLLINTSYAGEGMWLPIFLKALNESEMQSLGMKITAEDIYSVNQGSLKDAIAHFGGFCTSEVISKNGLLLTNHHCGYGQIQSHSSIDNNLLKNGFWAKNHSEELPNPGLYAMFINRIEDVSEEILRGVEEGMTTAQRESIVQSNIDNYKGRVRLAEFHDIIIRPFYAGNQYFAFYTVRYNDVRLVGTPPESIGKFGADTDNWVWPRHTGDFSLFRIYAGPNNEPADYSEENIPFTPKHSLPISLDGVEEGDFTMVFGFPGRTNQYLPSIAVKEIVEKHNPARIKIRDTALKIIEKYMRADEETRLMYSSKFARVANYWKKWIGESLGIKKTNAIQKKLDYEAEFLARAEKEGKYKDIFKEFDDYYNGMSDSELILNYYSEIGRRNVELLSMMSNVRRLVNAYENNGEKAYQDFKARLLPYMENFYKNYNSEIDNEVAVSLLNIYAEDIDGMYIPNSLKEFRKDNAIEKMVNSLYQTSEFTSLDKVSSIMSLDPKTAVEKIKNDPAYQFSEEWQSIISEKVNPINSMYKAKIDSLQQVYMAAQMELFPEKRFYPDANSTMRVTYGQVEGFQPEDGKCYTPLTYLNGTIAKYIPGDYEFDLPAKLLELYESKDYGDYKDHTGEVPVCFLGSNHTTGGNSGSPAIDAYGNLVGLNFDRVWEGTMSDINYDISLCRNIMVDTRFVLFVIDKMAGATHLIEEMELVHPKKSK